MKWADSTYAPPSPVSQNLKYLGQKSIIYEELCLLVYNVMQSGENLQKDVSLPSRRLLPASCLLLDHADGRDG